VAQAVVNGGHVVGAERLELCRYCRVEWPTRQPRVMCAFSNRFLSLGRLPATPTHPRATAQRSDRMTHTHSYTHQRAHHTDGSARVRQNDTHTHSYTRTCTHRQTGQTEAHLERDKILQQSRP
jgi:hypothetical protein